jgi:hypothetical protein
VAKAPKRMTGQAIKAQAQKIAEQVQRRAGAGVGAAAVFLAARIKETVSVPAPRKRVVNRVGDIRYVATQRAIPGAPPRKLSNKLRQSVTYELPGVIDKLRARAVVGVKARSKNGFNYPKHLEKRGHPFMAPTIRKYRRDLVAIVDAKIKVRTL